MGTQIFIHNQRDRPLCVFFTEVGILLLSDRTQINFQSNKVKIMETIESLCLSASSSPYSVKYHFHIHAPVQPLFDKIARYLKGPPLASGVASTLGL